VKKFIWIAIALCMIGAGFWVYQRYEAEQRQASAESERRLRRLNKRLQLENNETKLSTLETEAEIAKLKGKPFNRNKIEMQRILVDTERRGMALEDDLDEMQRALSH
jgi:hypothetical protein